MAQRGRVEVIAERPYWREAEAEVVVEAWRRSGETLEEFATRHGLVKGRIARWAARLERRAPVQFHPVRVVGMATGPADVIEVVLVDGRRVRIPPGVDANDLGRVLAVLEGRSC